MTNFFFRRIAQKIPGLPVKLKQAGMPDTPEMFVKKTFMSAFYMTTGLVFVIGSVLARMQVVLSVLYVITPILFFVLFLYFLKLPDVKIIQMQREIDREIVFAGRFLIVELESGVLLYNALKNVSGSYGKVGKTFGDIINAVDIGTSMEEAITEAIDYSPSPDMRRILWQIMNSLRAGSDVTSTLSSVLDQIARGQIIEIQRYAKKLNPLAMFYMMIAVIIPSLGITMLIVISSFLSIKIGIVALVFVAIVLGFVQFMFLAIVRTSRPAVSV